MLKCFWIVVALVGLLWYRNVRYAIKQYLANRNYVLFFVYMGFLGALGYLIVFLSTRTISLVQVSQDVTDISQNI